MATNAEVAAWLAANPTASDAEITAAANAAGVSASQLAQVTGLNESTVASRMAAASSTPQVTPVSVSTPAASAATIKDYRGKTYDLAQLKSLASQLATIADPAHLSGGAFGEKEGNIGFAYKDLAGALGANPTTFDQVLMDAARGLVDRGVTDINQIKPPEGAGADYTGAGKGAGETYTGPGKTSYAVDFINGKPYLNVTGDSSSFFNSDIGKAALAGGAYFAAPMLSGAIGGATGLTGANLAAATGATLGAGGAALTGNDVLKGALLGGAVGYGTGMLSGSQASAADAMAADNIDVGGGWNPATGMGDAATAAAAAQTGVTSSAGTPHLFTPSGLDVTTGALPTGALTGTSGVAGTGLTASQLASLAKAGISVAGLLGGAKLAGNLAGGGSNLSLPTQDRSGVSSGSAQYSPEYYQAIQAKYNQMMPQQQPRDVTTALKDWYETKYAPTATITPKVI